MKQGNRYTDTEAHMTQEEVAERLDMTRTNVNAIERTAIEKFKKIFKQRYKDIKNVLGD